MIEELRGLLAAGVLPEILRRIFLAQRTGTLHLAFGTERADFDFDDGYLTGVATGVPGGHLSDLLVQLGFLRMRDCAACLEIAALANERLGETLLRHGLIDAEHLARGLALQFREVLARTLAWGGGVYTFADSQPGESGSPTATVEPRLDPREILLDAIWSLIGEPALDGFLGDLNQKLRKATDERLLRLDFKLSPADAFVLSRVDGELTALELFHLCPATVDEVKASLAGLLAAGAVEYVGAAPPISRTGEIARLELGLLAARVESPDPFEVLGISPKASRDELRSAYLDLLRRCDPSTTADAHLKPMLRRMSNQLASAFKEIERRGGGQQPAFFAKRPDRHTAAIPLLLDVLSQRGAVPLTPAGSQAAHPLDRSAPPVSPPLASRVAPVPKAADRESPVVVVPGPRLEPAPLVPGFDPTRAIEAAAEAAEEGRLLEALAMLHEAIPRLTGRDRRAARVRRARLLLAVENGVKLAEAELRAAIAEDSGNVEAHIALGGIYQERGSLAMAAGEYRKALELQPRHAGAREALDRLQALPTDNPPLESALKKPAGG